MNFRFEPSWKIIMKYLKREYKRVSKLLKDLEIKDMKRILNWEGDRKIIETAETLLTNENS